MQVVQYVTQQAGILGQGAGQAEAQPPPNTGAALSAEAAAAGGPSVSASTTSSGSGVGDGSTYLPPLFMQYVNVSMAALALAQVVQHTLKVFIRPSIDLGFLPSWSGFVFLCSAPPLPALRICSCLAQVQASFIRDVLWVGPTVPPGTSSDGNPTDVVLDLAQLQGVIGLGGSDSGFYMQVGKGHRPTQFRLVFRLPPLGRWMLQIWKFEECLPMCLPNLPDNFLRFLAYICSG